MENRAHAFTAGLFVILLCAAAIFAIKWFSNEDIAYDRYFLISTGGSVSGLNPEASVRYRGVNVGKVEGIYFSEMDAHNIVVQIVVSTDVSLPHNIYAQLASQGITGLAYVELNVDAVDPDSAMLKPNARIPLKQSLVKTLSNSVEKVLTNSETTIEQINNLLSEQNQTHVNNILKLLEQTLRHYDELGTRLQHDLRALPQLTRDMSATFKQARQTLEDSSHTLHKLNQPQGLISHLTQNSQEITDALTDLKKTSQAVTHSTRKLDRLLQTLEAQPQSLLFGKPSAAPGPGESGFVPPRREK